MMVRRPQYTRAEYDAVVRSRLIHFFSWGFGQLHPGLELVRGMHMHVLAEALSKCARGETKRLLITMPPRNLKSEFASIVFPAWLLGQDPTRKIINITYSEALTKDFARGTKALMESADYRRMFPRSVINPRASADTDFSLARYRGRRFGTTVFGPITGFGGDFIIIDDAIKPEDARSDTKRLSVNEWFESTVLSRLDHKESGVIIVIMQRLHVDDLAGRLIEAGGWTHLNLPAIATERQVLDAGDGLMWTREVGSALNPKFESLETLRALRATMGEDFFQAQYQQSPVMPGGNIIKLEWLQRFSRPLKAEPNAEVVFSIDTAFATGDNNDWTVCTVWLVQNDRYYLIDLFRERLGNGDFIACFPELWRRYAAYQRTILLEKINGMELVAAGLEKATGEAPELVPPVNSKVSRLWALTPLFQQGRVFLPEDAPWLNDYVKELTSFPRGRHDDQVDTTSQFLAWITSRPDLSVRQHRM